MRGSGQKIVGFSFYGDINTPKNKKKGKVPVFELLIHNENFQLFFDCLLFQYSILWILGYFEGIVGNLELMPIYYPGWVMRVYYDLDDDDPGQPAGWPAGWPAVPPAGQPADWPAG